MCIVSWPIRSEMKPQQITAKPPACLSHDLIQNNELAFSSNELTFLQKPNYRIWNRPRSEIYNGITFPSQLQKTRIKNHQSQPTSMTLWTACEAHWSALLLIGSALSSLVWSYLLDSTSLSCKYVTKHSAPSSLFQKVAFWQRFI